MDCLYTSSLTQKRKNWKDGTLHVTENCGKADIVVKDVRGDVVARAKGLGGDWKERADESELLVGRILVQLYEDLPEPVPQRTAGTKRTADKRFTPFVIRDFQIKPLDPTPQAKYRKTESALARLPDYNVCPQDVAIFNTAIGITASCGDDFGSL
eukprot:TRINITY_DN23130_c0_g1_i1.p1 TRINITY_DN23130_c0_g1~~TRINITY_DN23130_c0_g1_i1.p1  ORF type:complete len:155 (+),score=27.00 TRINITY_DN23130_c0_g1_i1:80-544(+)